MVQDLTSRARSTLAARLLRVLCVLMGLLAIAVGAALLLTARPAQPVRVDGLIRDYRAVLVGGTYARSELNLVHDPRTYTFDRGSFSPPLPEQLYQNGQVVMWTDGAGGPVIALTLSDEHGLNPTTYSTPAYGNPDAPLWLGWSEGVGAAVLGLALAAGGPLLLALGSRRKMGGTGLTARSRRTRRPEARQTDETQPTLEQVAVEMPAVMIARRAAPAPAAAASASPPAPAGRPAPNMPPPGWASGALGSSWAGIEEISGPTPGAPRVERTIPTHPPAFAPAPATLMPAIDDLPTERTPSLSAPRAPRPAQPAERSYPPAGLAPPGGSPAWSPFGPSEPPSGPAVGTTIPSGPWEGYAPASPDSSALRPWTRFAPMGGQGAPMPGHASGEPAASVPGAGHGDIDDGPTAPTPAVTPRPEDSGPAPRTPLWPPARDTNGQ